MSQSPHPAEDRLRMTVRSAQILLLALIVGAAAGALTYAAGNVLPEAVLAGLGAAGGGIVFFDRLIAAQAPTVQIQPTGRRRRRRPRR